MGPISSSLILLAMLLAQAASNAISGPSYADVLANPSNQRERTISWVGKQVRVSTDLRNGERIVTSYTYTLVDARGGILLNQPFSVDGDAEFSPAAIAARGDSKDSGIRRISGRFKGLIEVVVYVEGKPKTMTAPRIEKATIDVPAR